MMCHANVTFDEILVATDIDRLKDNLRRWRERGFRSRLAAWSGSPRRPQWFRDIVMAHIEFSANGVLMVAFGFLVKELRLSPVADV